MKTGQHYQALIILAGIAGLFACQSAPDTEITQTEQANLAAQMAILKEKQQKYDAVVAEWQSMREGLQRLLIVEEELGLLIGQLDHMSNDMSPSQSTQQSAQTLTSPPVQDSTTDDIKPTQSTYDKFQHESEMPPRYALQLTAVISPARLHSLWRELSNKHPALLADLPANYQKITVKSTDYFRLKAGAFVTEAQATERCNALKSAGVGCIVSDYHAAPLQQLKP